MPKSLPKFTKKLIKWYLENKRSLPWRETSDPYKIWLSEIILQQTRVSQGLPYYERFIEAYPTVYELAVAEESDILKLWQGLGYYSRARNLHQAAKTVVDEFDGNFPSSHKDLLRLKGVGDYTASAIASICFDAPEAVVDGNVYRVLSRYFGIETPINSTKGFTQFKALAQELIDTSQPGTFNQALMEFGAQYCVPANPDCEHCIFNDSCWAYSKGKVGSLPVKEKKNKVRIRYFNYLVFLDPAGRTLMEKREGKGIWQHLYQFPLVESTKAVKLSALKKEKAFQTWAESYEIVSITGYGNQEQVHKLSHQHLKIRFWIVEVAQGDSRFMERETVLKKPTPIVLANFISEFPAFQL